MRWETPASVPILLPEPASGFHALQTIRIGSLDQRHRLDPPEILRYPEHEILIFLYFQRTDSLTNVDVVSSPALSVLGDLRAVQLRDQVLQYVGLLGTWGTVEVIGPAMIQRLVEMLAQ